jgi:hypothetical protein
MRATATATATTATVMVSFDPVAPGIDGLVRPRACDVLPVEHTQRSSSVPVISQSLSREGVPKNAHLDRSEASQYRLTQVMPIAWHSVVHDPPGWIFPITAAQRHESCEQSSSQNSSVLW